MNSSLKLISNGKPTFFKTLTIVFFTKNTYGQRYSETADDIDYGIYPSGGTAFSDYPAIIAILMIFVAPYFIANRYKSGFNAWFYHKWLLVFFGACALWLFLELESLFLLMLNIAITIYALFHADKADN